MARQKISRNDPCPCGSGKKYKLCCYGKNIDWGERQETARRPVLPRPVSKPSHIPFGPFAVVDAKLKGIAMTEPDGAWKSMVEGLSGATPLEERIKAYKAVRKARVIPDEAAEYLFVWTIQWLPLIAEPEEVANEEAAGREMDQETEAQLRKFGMDDLAEIFVSNRLEFDRRHERGRAFFYGPPNELLAKSLRAKGVID